MPLKATLYKSSKESNVRTDLDFTEFTLESLAERNKLSYNIIDTADFDEAKLFEAYAKVIGPSVSNRYKVRTIFGTNRNSGCFFGREQPALLVEGDVWGIYPHEKDKKKITIEDFLRNLLKTME